MTAAEKYVKDVLSSKVLVGRLVHKECERFSERLKRKDIYFDNKLADQIVLFCETILRFWEGEWRGHPVHIYPWQAFIIQNIFCWKWTDTGLRVTRSAYIEIARKNGKTTLAAIISFVHAFLDNDLTPQILVGANNEEQAKICTNTFAEMFEISPSTAELIRENRASVRRYGARARSVSFKFGNKVCLIEAMSRDVKTKDGFNPSLGIIDEFHEAPNDDLLNVLDSGQVVRKEPLLVTITTAGFNKYNPCYTRLRKSAINVLEGVVDMDSQISAIYELDDEDDWQDESVWAKANPNMEFVEMILPYLRIQCKKAQAEGTTTEVNFQTKNLNRWCDAAAVWIPGDVWVKNHRPELKISDIEGKGYGGLDLSATKDITSFGAVFPEAFELDGKVIAALISKNWLPAENSVYRGMDYRPWIKDGYIKPTRDNYLDIYSVIEDLGLFCQEYNINDIYFDKGQDGSVASSVIGTKLEKTTAMTPISMRGFSQSSAMKKFEIMATAEELEHFNNPVVKWALANTVPKYDPQGRDIRPEKEHVENKIDPVVALILAFQCWQETSILPGAIKPFVIGI